MSCRVGSCRVVSSLPSYWLGVERGREHVRVVMPTFESQTRPSPESRTRPFAVALAPFPPHTPPFVPRSRPLSRPPFRWSLLATLPSPRRNRRNRTPSRPPTRHNRNNSRMGKGWSTRWHGRKGGEKNRESTAACFDALLVLTPSQPRHVHATFDCALIALVARGLALLCFLNH